VFGTAAAAPIGASTLLERAGSMAVSHGAVCYRGCASPLAQPTEGRRLPQARVKGKSRQDAGYVRSPKRSLRGGPWQSPLTEQGNRCLQHIAVDFRDVGGWLCCVNLIERSQIQVWLSILSG
jgi:hypothetical protein